MSVIVICRLPLHCGSTLRALSLNDNIARLKAGLARVHQMSLSSVAHVQHYSNTQVRASSALPGWSCATCEFVLQIKAMHRH
jgi:hypothetical protein